MNVSDDVHVFTNDAEQNEAQDTWKNNLSLSFWSNIKIGFHIIDPSLLLMCNLVHSGWTNLQQQAKFYLTIL